MVVKGKVERPLPSITFDIKQEVFFKLLGVYFRRNRTNWEKQSDSLLGKAGRRMHILQVCKKYGYSLGFLHHLFHSLIIPLFTYGISVQGVASYDKYLSKIDKFQKREVGFGFFKEAAPILSLLEASDNKLRRALQQISSHPISHPRLLRNRGLSYVLPQVRTERVKRCFMNWCLFSFIN